MPVLRSSRIFARRESAAPSKNTAPKNGYGAFAGQARQVKCGDCPNKAFIPVTSEVIECHLRGEDRVCPNGRGKDFVAGVYPLFFDDTGSFLAVDFDGGNWSSDALAFIAS